jgi:D-alanine transaminase
LNGRFLDLADAQVSVLDRGFIFGDGVYEVIPVFARRPFRLPQHFARLVRSLTAIGITPPFSEATWRAMIEELVSRSAFDDCSVYLQITRGVAPRNHAAPDTLTPTVFGMASSLAVSVAPEPVAAVTLEDLRWQRCDIKAISLLPNVMARTAATTAGAYEAILIRDGVVTEGAASNVFVISDGRIKTPPLSGFILPGITRDALIDALRVSSDAIVETEITRADLFAADEVWLASSTRDLVPVATLDGHPFKSAAPGPIFRRVNARYAEFKMAELKQVADISRRSDQVKNP